MAKIESKNIALENSSTQVLKNAEMRTSARGCASS
jgi:hypothetical protein